MGKLKRRIRPSDIVINIGKDAPIPECPIPGERYYSSRSFNFGKKIEEQNDNCIYCRVQNLLFV